MRTHQLTRAAFAVLVLAGTAALAMGPGGKKDSMICLVRPDDGPDGNAKGTLRTRAKGNGDSFEIHIMKVDNDEHHAWLEDPLSSGTFTDIGTLSSGGSQLLKFDTKKGDTLPLAAASLDDLIGRKLEIRHVDDVILEGTVPPWGLSKKPHKATADITAPDGAPQPDMHAALSLRGKDDKGQERIILKVKKIDWNSDEFHVFVEDGVGSGVFVDAGGLGKTGGHAGLWKRDTKQGQALPDDASFVSELAGRLIEVHRKSDDVVFLSGTIPMVE